MNTLNDILLALVREGIGKEHVDTQYLINWFSGSKESLEDLYTLASQQGMGAVVFDALQVHMSCTSFRSIVPKSLLLQWGMSAIQIEKIFSQQFFLAKEISDFYYKENVETIVLKGLVVAQYYPKPNHRPCCDMDCFLMGNYMKGNSIAKRLGADVDENDYKHSHILYKGLMIENHQFLTDFDGTSHGRKVEAMLQSVMFKRENHVNIANTHLIAPSRNFTVLFLLKHAHNHFITEGLSLRQLTDWDVFLEKEQKNINWNEVHKQIDVMHLRPFFDLITTWCVKYLKLQLQSSAIYTECDAKKLSSFYNDLQCPLLSTLEKKWWEKIPYIVSRYKRMWHFRYLLDESIFIKFWNTIAYCSYFHRTPKL